MKTRIFYLIRNCFLIIILCLIGCKIGRRGELYKILPNGSMLIGIFSGNDKDTQQLVTLMEANGIEVGLEGSFKYDLSVPVPKANIAWHILHTNDLSLRGKVFLPDKPPK